MISEEYINQKLDDLGYGNIRIQGRICIANWKETEVTGEKLNKVKLILEEAFPNTSFGYISDRTHLHSVKLTEVREVVHSVKNLEAIAFVTYQSRSHLVAELEARFYNIPNLGFFDSLDQAYPWMEKYLTEIEEKKKEA